MKKTYHDLNEEQREAVLHNNGPALILAGAGSGKTRVVTYRIMRLIEEMKVDPFSILAVTFTNKAAQSMKERVAELSGRGKVKDIFIGTFHALCLQILKIHSPKLGYQTGFTIYDDSDQQALIKECLWDLKWDEKLVNPRAVHSYISAAKNELKTPKDYNEMVAGIFMEKVAQIYPLYQTKLKQNNAMDFDDMLFNAVEILRLNPDVLDGYRKRFQYISVDEYQDINTSQYQLISMIAHPKNNLCVVGDPDQSIYGWRGADIRNILRFEQDFPGAKTFKLQQNYRSTRSIIQAAQAVIRNNSQRKEKELFSMREIGETPIYYQAEDDKDEAEFVLKTIYERLGEPGRSFRHVAILYRTNAQSRVLEDACRRHNIPYIIVGGLKFYDRREVKDMLAYFHVMANPKDSVSLRRMINIPIRGIGSGTVEKLEEAAKRLDLSMLDAARQSSLNGDFPKKTTQALATFVNMMDELIALKGRLKPSEFVKAVLERSGYLTELAADDSSESRMRIENLKELVNSVADYEATAETPTLEGYLDQVSLVADVDKVDDKKNCVTLMTMHNAKGLEYPIVFVTGMEEGLFPHQNSIDADDEVQEERRLCYVGLTRAMDILYLTGAASRNKYGTVEWRAPSRFLSEIPKDMIQFTGKAAGIVATQGGLYEVKNAKNKEFDELKDPEWDDAEPVMAPYMLGDTVKHAKFGKGMVLGLMGAGDDLKVTVSFPNHGKKQLLAKMAHLEKIE
ncbi:MAG TPA: UvrD-helicase domain-containing protein [bacterium]|jgi:DNA helicase-2/ATP-dependent DNA helicase PcrA|nr:UvrD-helicase domain-containing protein [bacterium]